MAGKQTDLQALYEAMSVYEKELHQKGYLHICGIDEVGRGPLAGPVVACACILDPQHPVLGVKDSKALSPKRRLQLFEELKEKALSYGIGVVSQEVIDEINILEATKRAMREAVQKLSLKPDWVLIDALTLPELGEHQTGIIKGDAKSVSIAAASILAKETRDAMALEWDRLYPEYGFASHKGYGTRAHIEAIFRYGPLPIHRKSFLQNLKRPKD